jgi:hypothetical protein
MQTHARQALVAMHHFQAWYACKAGRQDMAFKNERQVAATPATSRSNHKQNMQSNSSQSTEEGAASSILSNILNA